MQRQALTGIRVLDFTRVLAGPLCTMTLGDLGADIIKIENPAHGDDTRQWGPPWLGAGDQRQSAYFLSVNRNKRSLTLNLKHQTGRDIARQLTAHSHIVIENFKLGQMDDFGLGYNDLKQINPALIYCSITGFGQTGLYRERAGYDYAIQAMSGLMSITGAVDGEPHKVGVAISDVIAGLYATNAIQAALRHSEQTGEGQYIDIALLDAQIAALVNIASNYLVSGDNPPRFGNQHPNIVPYQTFRASDKDFVVAVGNDRQFALLCNLIDRSELAADPRFITNPMRVKNRDELIDLLQEAFKTRTADQWVDSLLTIGVPAGPINDVGTILDDPHIQQRELIQQTTLDNGETLRFVASPLKLSQTPTETRLPPPSLGQHTAEILRDILNLDEKTIAAYRADGVI
jgi:formyl-CoA transferase